MARPTVMCHMGAKRVRNVRCRGGNRKYRALRLDAGNFAWGSENSTKKCRILDVLYNASSNELVRTKTLCKNAVIQVDAQPFKQYYLKRYGLDLSKKEKQEKEKEKEVVKETKVTKGKKGKDAKGKEKE